MMAECPICGKKTAIYWPQFYVYRRGKKFFCGADCTEVYDMQRYRARTGWVDRRKTAKPIIRTPQKDKTQQNETTQERKKETMKRNKLTLEQKKKAMEIYQAGGDAGVTMTAQEVSAKGIEGIPASIDLESGKVTTERMERPALTGSFRIRTVEGRFGTYDVYTDKEGTQMFSFSNEKGDEVQMPAAKWLDLMEEIGQAAQILGVAL